MAAVEENRIKRGKRVRQMSGDRSVTKICAACGSETRWLSVDGLCWSCTVQAAKNKTPLFVEQQEDETESENAGPENDW